MTQTHFFALRDDILAVLRAVEHESLTYTRIDNQLQPDFDQYKRGEDIPGLGTASAASGVACTTFLVTRRTTKIQVEESAGLAGVRRYHVSQLSNPDSVTLTPAGVWTDGTILYGRVATCSGSEISKTLMRLFRGAIRQRFAPMHHYWVGPQALDCLKVGRRLTIAVQSPPEFDLEVNS